MDLLGKVIVIWGVVQALTIGVLVIWSLVYLLNLAGRVLTGLILIVGLLIAMVSIFTGAP